ncbi:MAG: hypothetical protein IJ880_15205 [Bacilli bacterium]|nr:hypothetical protein [Bacilli bacterium]
MVIAIDFDGTCVTHEYPKVGKDIGAVPVLKKLREKGHLLILHTMRFEETERDAINWFIANDILLYGVNRNKTQWRWSKSPKIYANLYIDDAALGCPLKTDPELSDRPFVDWEAVEKLLIEKGIL